MGGEPLADHFGAEDFVTPLLVSPVFTPKRVVTNEPNGVFQGFLRPFASARRPGKRGEFRLCDPARSRRRDFGETSYHRHPAMLAKSNRTPLNRSSKRP